jgi:hypothetical protein
LTDEGLTCQGSGPLPDETELGYFGPAVEELQETRLGCLRLRSGALSYRQIAARLGISKRARVERGDAPRHVELT